MVPLRFSSANVRIVSVGMKMRMMMPACSRSGRTSISLTFSVCGPPHAELLHAQALLAEEAEEAVEHPAEDQREQADQDVGDR